MNHINDYLFVVATPIEAFQRHTRGMGARGVRAVPQGRSQHPGRWRCGSHTADVTTGPPWFQHGARALARTQPGVTRGRVHRGPCPGHWSHFGYCFKNPVSVTKTRSYSQTEEGLGVLQETVHVGSCLNASRGEESYIKVDG